jgi:hypothetical protein
MKSSVAILVCLPLFSFLLGGNCHKPKSEDNLPPATQTGANTFGCLVDGKVWIPTGRGVGSGINPTSGGFFRNPDGKSNIYIKAYSDNDNIDIYLKGITQTGIYSLNKNTDVKPNIIYPESYGAYFIDGQDYYVTDSLHIGNVNITYADTTTVIVAGTFSMQLYQKSTGKIITITNGRFDYKTH